MMNLRNDKGHVVRLLPVPFLGRRGESLDGHCSCSSKVDSQESLNGIGTVDPAGGRQGDSRRKIRAG